MYDFHREIWLCSYILKNKDVLKSRDLQSNLFYKFPEDKMGSISFSITTKIQANSIVLRVYSFKYLVGGMTSPKIYSNNYHIKED